MKFTHVVQVNAPGDPLIEPLSREQLWRGLMWRTERPQELMPQLISCRIVARGKSLLARELDFGSFTVRDRVRVEPMQQLVYETQATDDVRAGTLTITIEESEPGGLQVRFAYDVTRVRKADDATEAMYDGFLKSAYLEADIDSLRRIRERAGTGML
jgi:hypothetical protein